MIGCFKKSRPWNGSNCVRHDFFMHTYVCMYNLKRHTGRHPTLYELDYANFMFHSPHTHSLIKFMNSSKPAIRTDFVRKKETWKKKLRQEKKVQSGKTQSGVLMRPRLRNNWQNSHPIKKSGFYWIMRECSNQLPIMDSEVADNILFTV